jgi:hypothetical protein
MQYFNLQLTEDDAHRLYLKLSKELHPDTGGSSEDFQLLKKEYEEFKIVKKYENELIFNNSFNTFDSNSYNQNISPANNIINKLPNIDLSRLPNVVRNVSDVVKEANVFVKEFKKLAKQIKVK